MTIEWEVGRSIVFFLIGSLWNYFRIRKLKERNTQLRNDQIRLNDKLFNQNMKLHDYKSTLDLLQYDLVREDYWLCTCKHFKLSHTIRYEPPLGKISGNCFRCSCMQYQRDPNGDTLPNHVKS